jgi:hypothetical protein
MKNVFAAIAISAIGCAQSKEQEVPKVVKRLQKNIKY